MTTPLFSATIPGRPVPCARPRVTRKGTYNPKAKELKALARELFFYNSNDAITRAVSLHVVFSYEPPKSWSKQRRSLALDHYIHPTSCDLDNLLKMVCDALQLGKVISDDRHICHFDVTKLYGTEEFTNIEIWPWGGDVTASHDHQLHSGEV